MSPERPQPPTTVQPIASLDDPRAITLLTTEHWSLLSARSLAYNEAFVRAGMFLTFLSMSFVALALLAQAMSFGGEFLTVTAIVLAFDLVIGVTTYMRMNGANYDDLRAVHGMARIRHAYTQITPIVTPYFTTPIYDDIDSVTAVYGPISDRLPGQIAYGLSTSSGMIGLIVSMVAGVLITVLVMLAGVAGGGAIGIGAAGGVAFLVGLVAYTAWAITRGQGEVASAFPSPATRADADVPASAGGAEAD